MDDKINSKDTSVDTEALEKIEGEISELAKIFQKRRKKETELRRKPKSISQSQQFTRTADL